MAASVLQSLFRKHPLGRNVFCRNHSVSRWSYRYKKIYQGPVQAVIFDWAGTVVDCGVLAPVYTFVRLFEDEGVTITEDEARRPMGAHKRVHIETILEMSEVRGRWIKRKGAPPTDRDVQRMYDNFVPTIMTCLSKHSALIPGVRETVDELKNSLDVKLGSTTGYPSQVMDVLLKLAAQQGFAPDANVAADQVPEARPCPYMVWSCAMRLGVHPVQSLVKVDDTVDGIGEGLSAGCWTAAVVKTGNYVGLTEEQLRTTDPDDLRRRERHAYEKMAAAGSHYVIDSVRDLPHVIRDINRRLTNGESP